MSIIFKIKKWQKNRDEKRRQQFLKFKEERILQQKILEYRHDPNVKWTRREYVGSYREEVGGVRDAMLVRERPSVIVDYEIWDYFGTCPYTNKEFFIRQKSHYRCRQTGRLLNT